MRIFTLAGIVILLFGCSERDSVLVSPSGVYRGWLSIHQEPGGLHIWAVHITTGEDQVELLEFMNDYPANLMAYIDWDGDERLWFYSSDDGSYFYWEREENGWRKHSWSILESSVIYPPASLEDQGERN